MSRHPSHRPVCFAAVCGVLLLMLAACQQQEISRSEPTFRSPLATGNASKVTTGKQSGSSQQKKGLTKVPGQPAK